MLVSVPPKAAMESYTVPDGVETIGYAALASCDYITELVIPEGVKNIEMLGCSCIKMQKVYLPHSLESIYYYGFYGGEQFDFALQYVVYNGTKEEWSNVELMQAGNEPLLNAKFIFLGDEESVKPDTDDGKDSASSDCCFVRFLKWLISLFERLRNYYKQIF